MHLARWFLLSRVLPVGVYYLVGAGIEDAIAKRPGRRRLFNSACSSFLQLFDFTVGGYIVAGLGRIIEAIPRRPQLLASRPGFWFALLVALLVSISSDFFYYWFHRWQHSSRWLWPIHELHHSDEDVNITTSFRFHWLEEPMRLMLGFPAALVLPRTALVLPLLYLLGCGGVLFLHLDAPISFGWFNRVMANPATHRIHHSRLPEHIDKNFAAMWPFWDALFGTYVQPRRGERPPTGLAGGAGEYNLRDAIVKPFVTWRRMLQGGETR